MFKSEAQRKRLLRLVKEGKFSQKAFDEIDKETPEVIPDRAALRPKTILRKPIKPIKDLK